MRVVPEDRQRLLSAAYTHTRAVRAETAPTPLLPHAVWINPPWFDTLITLSPVEGKE